MSKSCRGLFITGTDTGVGKTYVAALIARALTAAGHRVGVYKPVASGCERVSGELISADAQLLWEAAGRPGKLIEVCPQRFEMPLAPHLAARAMGSAIDCDRIRDGFELWRKRSDIVLVEGAGGLMSPVSDDEFNADWAADFGLPLVVVARNQIGVIHQALTTLIAAACFGDGLPVAGIVLNRMGGSESDPSVPSNGGELAQRAVPPLVAEVSFGGDFDRAVDWFALARSAES